MKNEEVTLKGRGNLPGTLLQRLVQVSGNLIVERRPTGYKREELACLYSCPCLAAFDSGPVARLPALLLACLISIRIASYL
jgi:hypothetical protein